MPPTDETARTMHMTNAICDGSQALCIATRVSYCKSRPVHTMPAVPMVIQRTSGMPNRWRRRLCWPPPRRLAGGRRTPAQQAVEAERGQGGQQAADEHRRRDVLLLMMGQEQRVLVRGRHDHVEDTDRSQPSEAAFCVFQTDGGHLIRAHPERRS